MGFEQYRTELSPFDLYYDKFLQNTFRGRSFEVTLTSGDSLVRVPTAGSIVDPRDATFNFRDARGATYRIPFHALERAEERV
jgi:hypothetical protein